MTDEIERDARAPGASHEVAGDRRPGEANDDVDLDDELAISHDEATDTLRAIRAGRVDAVVIRRQTKEEVLTFRDPDHAYRALVEAMAEGAAIVTPDGIICYHNPRFVELTTGSRDRAVRGFELRQLVPGDAAAPIDALLERAREGPVRIEVELARSGDQTVPVQLTASPTAIAEHAVLCVVVTDLGEQRRQEELYREALVGMERRERLLSVAGHELRSPLQSISLHLEMLQEQCRGFGASPPPHPAFCRRVDQLRAQTDTLAKLVGSLLDLGRVESDQLELVLEEVDLAEVVRAEHDHSRELVESGSEVELVTRPVRGSWDRVRIAQVAANLISNAAKYGLGKPIRIVVEGDEQLARLVVSDHGIGIDRDAIGRLFLPFERIGSVKAASGLGLGLYISAQIVDAHGGTIRVESEPGAGSSFIVELPRRPH